MTSPEERFDDAFAIEIRVARYLNISCAHCGLKRGLSMAERHVCPVVIREWITRIAPHAPSFALLMAEDLMHLQRTGEHLWRPDMISIK
jgi:hypothetical protein